MSESGQQDWGAIRDEARQQVLRRLSLLGITDLESHIKFETNFTPQLFFEFGAVVKTEQDGDRVAWNQSHHQEDDN